MLIMDHFSEGSKLIIPNATICRQPEGMVMVSALKVGRKVVPFRHLLGTLEKKGAFETVATNRT